MIFLKQFEIPELNIPRSMRNMMPKEAPEVEAKPFEDKADFDFNLEDTILAAASAQGIDIPEESRTPEIRKNHREEEEKSEQVADLTMDDLEEEIFSEEDLERAERSL